MSTLPQAICRYNAILIKIPMVFFNRNRKKILEYVWDTKDPKRAKSNPEKEE